MFLHFQFVPCCLKGKDNKTGLQPVSKPVEQTLVFPRMYDVTIIAN